jgi:preprotein translocase subunit SecG
MSKILLANNDLVIPWIADNIAWVQGVFVALMALSAIIMIIAILVSPPQTGVGNNAITGQNESYYSKNKKGTNVGRIRNVIIVCASIIAFCAIMYFVLYGIYHDTTV